jgi:murein DD-endopeptidase MepM/ murein hydrolase activator NlpD
MQKTIISFALFSVFIFGCKIQKLPPVRHTQYTLHLTSKAENNELLIDLRNPLNCPLRIWIYSSVNEMQSELNKINPVVMKAQQDTLITFAIDQNINYNISFSSRLGDPSQKIIPIELELPFPKNRSYTVIQGNNTNYTHNTSWSRYAVDFNLAVNDTICAATSGFVVGVIDEYKLGGIGNEWKPYGNFITIYEPNSGLFTQYAHLVHKGSLVKPGDKIERGQPIALSGKTGQTDIEHLHFNCLIPANNNDGLESTPFVFSGGYKSQELKNGDSLGKAPYPTPHTLSQ